MLKVLGAITATAIALGASTAFGETMAADSHKAVRAEWAKNQAQGGYGFPLTTIPAAIASAFTGKDSRDPIAQSQDLKAKSN